MLSLPESVRIFVATHPVDGRRGIDSLAALVRSGLGHDPLAGALFVFFSKRCDRARILYFSHGGYWLLSRRLERGRFCLPWVNMSANHRNQQKMRLLAPLFEEAGVDIVFAGHVHNYQRSKPLRFAPKDAIPEWGQPVRGTFTFDEKFDGATNTKPDGVLYIVTGGGGAELYPFRGRNATPATPVYPDPDTPGNYMTKVIDDRHSFTLMELDADKLLLRQIDVNGVEADRITVTKR